MTGKWSKVAENQNHFKLNNTQLQNTMLRNPFYMDVN